MRQAVISREIPPVYEELANKFGVTWESGIVIAYDGKIHCKKDVEPQKIVHELVHLDRQKEIGNEAWWRLYLDNDVFRLEEETLAYKAEADFLKRHIKNREVLFHMLRDIADIFSGSIYGKIISKQEALAILSN